MYKLYHPCIYLSINECLKNLIIRKVICSCIIYDFICNPLALLMTLHSLHQPTLCPLLTTSPSDHTSVILAEFTIVLPPLTPDNITVYSTKDCIAETESSLYYSWVIHVETGALASQGISFNFR